MHQVSQYFPSLVHLIYKCTDDVLLIIWFNYRFSHFWTSITLKSNNWRRSTCASSLNNSSQTTAWCTFPASSPPKADNLSMPLTLSPFWSISRELSSQPKTLRRLASRLTLRLDWQAIRRLAVRRLRVTARHSRWRWSNLTSTWHSEPMVRPRSTSTRTSGRPISTG